MLKNCCSTVSVVILQNVASKTYNIYSVVLVCTSLNLVLYTGCRYINVVCCSRLFVFFVISYDFSSIVTTTLITGRQGHTVF